MNLAKRKLLAQIRAHLEADENLLLQAAASAHAAATDEENIPVSKYETLSVEASYIAQGQANRAQEIRGAIDAFARLKPLPFAEDEPIRLGALVLLVDEKGQQLQLFLGPAAGGLKLNWAGEEILLITPESPLGRALLGKTLGEEVQLRIAQRQPFYEILRVS